MGITTSIGTNSYATKSAAAYYYYYNRNAGNSFYGLTLPMYKSETYYSLSNNGPGAGARTRRIMPRMNNRDYYTDYHNLTRRFM